MMMPQVIRDEALRVNTNFKFRNEDEKKLHAWVNAEVQDMIDYARPARELGSDAIRGYMSIVHKSRNYKKDRSDISFPLLHSVIYSRMTIEAARAPQCKFKARTEEDEPNMKWIEATIKNSEKGGFNRAPVDHVYFEQVFDKNLLGVGAVYQGYEFQTRLTHVRDENGNWRETTEIVEDDIRERNIDFFNFGVSRDMKPGMFDGRACYWDEFFDESSFFSKYGNNPFYMNISKDMIPDGDWFMGQGGQDYAKPQMWKGIYRVRHFWDIVNDLMYEQANGIPIRVDYILDYGDSKNPKKMLPIFTIHNDMAFDFDRPSATTKFATQNNRFYTEQSEVNTNKSFWSKPESLIVKPIVAAKNTFGRAMIDWLKASSVQFVIGPTGVIDRINKGKLYGIEPIKLDSGTFESKSLVSNSTFLNDFAKADAFFDKSMHAALGRDIGRASQENPPQATVAAAQRELEKQRDAQNNRYNSTGGIVRKYWHKYLLVKQYIPMPRKVKINDVGQLEDVDEHRIIRDADGKPLLILQSKNIDLDEAVAEVMTERTIRVKDKGGKEYDKIERSYRLVDPSHSEAIKQGSKAQNFFPNRKDYFVTKADPEITIEPLSSFQDDNALDKAVVIEQLQTLLPFLTLSVNGEPVVPKEFITYMLTNAAIPLGMDPEQVRNLLKGDSMAKDSADEIAPPPFPDQQDVTAGMNGEGGMPPGFESLAAGGGQGGGIVQTQKQGTPPRAGATMNTNAALAASLSM